MRSVLGKIVWDFTATLQSKKTGQENRPEEVIL